MFLPIENLMRRDVYKPQTITEYRNEYKAHMVINKPHRYRPDIDSFINRYGYTPMQNETTNRHDYVVHPVKRTPPPNPIYFKSPYKMETSTSYSKEYTNKTAHVSQPIRCDLNKADTKDLARPFTANATYKNDFKRWDVRNNKREMCKFDKWQPIDVNFKTSDSTYDADFIKFDQKPKERIKSADVLITKTNTPFTKRSGYKDEFVEHSLPDHYFVPRYDRFNFKTNKRFYKPDDLRILKGFSQPEKPDNENYQVRRVSIESDLSVTYDDPYRIQPTSFRKHNRSRAK